MCGSCLFSGTCAQASCKVFHTRSPSIVRPARPQNDVIRATFVNIVHAPRRAVGARDRAGATAGDQVSRPGGRRPPFPRLRHAAASRSPSRSSHRGQDGDTAGGRPRPTPTRRRRGTNANFNAIAIAKRGNTCRAPSRTHSMATTPTASASVSRSPRGRRCSATMSKRRGGFISRRHRGIRTHSRKSPTGITADSGSSRTTARRRTGSIAAQPRAIRSP
jgi:hypothetical protein